MRPCDTVPYEHPNNVSKARHSGQGQVVTKFPINHPIVQW